MKFVIDLFNGDRTQPNTDAPYRTYGIASTDYILASFSSLLAHNKKKPEFYRHQSLHTTARNEAAIPTGPNYHEYLFYLSEFPPGYHSDVSQLIVYLLYPVPTPPLS